LKSYIKYNKVITKIIEIHASHICNFKCESCSHFSFATYGKNLNHIDLENQLKIWSQKIYPSEVKVLGGEPFLNKDLESILKICKKYFPNSLLRIATNGLLIKKSKINLNIFKESLISLEISIHDNTDDYKNELFENIKVLNENKIPFRYINSIKNWRRMHKIENNIITPFQDNNQRQSWLTCDSKYYPQLFDNKIYKCPPTTYINLVKRQQLSDLFKPMLEYKPLEHTSSLEEIVLFLNKEDENICSLCPAKIEFFKKQYRD
jgi:organic radical activating enzyme